MKRLASQQTFKLFVYVDSSEQEADASFGSAEKSSNVAYSVQKLPKCQSEFQFRVPVNSENSPQETSPLSHSPRQNSPQQSSPQSSRPLRLCEYGIDANLHTMDYHRTIKQLLENKALKDTNHNMLLLDPSNNAILDEVQRRKQLYGLFMKQVAVEEKHRCIMQAKIRKTKEQNARHKQILEAKRRRDAEEEQQKLQRKYAIEKMIVEEQVVTGVTRFARKMAMEAANSKIKHVKNQIKSRRNDTEHLISNLTTKQKNDLEELREKMEELKTAKRIRKLDQEKALREQEKQNEKERALLRQRLTIKNDFVV